MKATAASNPERIVLIRPCCIGDVVMATAALSALRQTFPDAHISWAVGPWSARAIAHHAAIDEIVDTGADMPLKSLTGFIRLVRLLRAGDYELAVSLARSPLMSLAVWLAGIPLRAGLDSNGRGFGYNRRVAIDPDEPEHESEIYLKVVSALAGRELHAFAKLPVRAETREFVRATLEKAQVEAPFIVAHPGGGLNPGMRFDGKRFPPDHFAELVNHVAEARGAGVILLGGPADNGLVDEVAGQLKVRHVAWVDRLTFPEIGALAADALVYIGNDSGLTHLAAASGAKTVMLMGPTDPRRYAPYTRDSMAIWTPSNVGSRGVAEGPAEWMSPQDFEPQVDVAVKDILDFLDQ